MDIRSLPAEPAPSAIAASLPIRTAIVGTGYIAEFHARAVSGVKGAELIAVCDANLRSARSFASSWRVPEAFDLVESLLRKQPVDCVHVLVPPDAHYAVTKAALLSGAHVFLEKPMCTSAAEADELMALARARGLRLGVNHNFLFAGAYQRLRAAIRAGDLGPLDHVSINHFFELGPIRTGPFDIWMLREPGNAILEIGPHLLSVLLDLVGAPDSLSVTADRDIDLPGGGHVFRRWLIRATVGRTAVDINVNLGPGFGQRTIHARGLTGAATVDLDANTCTIDRRTPLDIDFDRYKRSLSLARQLRSQARHTLADYVLSRLKLRQGGNPYQTSISNAVAAFYSGLRREDRLDSRIDGSFGRRVVELCGKVVDAAKIAPTAPRGAGERTLSRPPTVLVLGGSGFIGRELIRQLLAAGYSVRAMVRGSRALLDELDGSLEIVGGDMRNAADLKSALQGIEFVYHLAHSAAKTWDDYVANEVDAARLVAEACLAAGVKRLIYTGTIASYYTGAKAATITEETPLDPAISRRSHYPRAKAASEALLMDMHDKQALPVVILRPGIVIGRGGEPFHWGVGRFSEGVCEVWGEGEHPLPFVLVADVAAALVRAAEVEGIEGRSYNLADAPLLTARDYLSALQQRAGIKLTVQHRPIWRFYAEDMCKWAVKMAVRHPDRIRVPSYSDWELRTGEAVFDCARAHSELGWTPAADRERLIEEGIGGSLEAWVKATG